MNKLKDFIYDKNDIIIAVLILVVAALIIGWRLNVILEYPKQLLNTDTPQASDTDDGQTSQGSDKDDDSKGDDDSSGGKNEDGGSAEVSLWQGGAITKDVEVNVTGSSASAAIQCLVDAGLFDDYAEYQSICAENGLDHEKVRAGVFTFKKGSTKLSIAKEMNWG